MSAPQNLRELRFAVDDWAALAAGLSAQEEWLAWFNQPTPVTREFSADLSWMAPTLRRRVSPAGRAALNVLATCHTESCPVVFASSYGDLAATAELLTQLHREETLSPIGFSLAVHNAVVGIYSIARKDRASSTSIASSSDLAELAFFEALGWIASGATSVLVVCCGEAVPSPYLPENDRHEFRHAWACRLRKVAEGGFSLSSSVEGEKFSDTSSWSAVESPSLRALAFLVGGQAKTMVSETGRYLWKRHD